MQNTDNPKTLTVPVERLVPGLYVDLKLSWKQHPFLFSRFKLKSAEEIAIIQQLGLKTVTVFPDRSDAKAKEHDAPNQPDNDPEATRNTLWDTKRKRIDAAAQYRRRRGKVAHRYQETVKKVKRLNQDLNANPANAMRDAGEVIAEMTSAFTHQGDLLINLINLADSDYSYYNHALNVTVLSMTLGRAIGLEAHELHDLGMAAMLHDIGKAMIPNKIVMKRGPLSKTENKLLETHTQLGGKLARNLRQLRPEVIEVIEQHHEFIDGSGYPKGLKGDALKRNTRIVAITNLYDDLCNPANSADALPPKAVMAILFKKYANKLDSTLVQQMIACMGVYPPGTVVQLSDQSIGLVTAVNTKALLKPHVLLYNPEIPRNEALAIDLTEHDDLSIVDVLRPGDYDKRIYDYLGIQERIGYFYENLNPPM